MSIVELVADADAVGAAEAAPGDSNAPPDILSQLETAVADRAQWPTVVRLLRAMSRPSLAAWSSAREARIEPLARTLDFCVDGLRADLDTPVDPGHYLLGRLDALLDVCLSAMDAALSEEALAVARNKYVPEILAHLAEVGDARRKDLMELLEFRTDSHLSNILKRMEMVELVRRTDLGGSVTVSLGLHGEAALKAVCEERATGGEEAGEELRLAELATVDEDAKVTLRALALEPRRTSGEASGGVAPGRSVLLYGPPGCGKTSIALALAKDLSARVIRVDGVTLLSANDPDSVLASSIATAGRSSRPLVLLLDDEVLLASSAGDAESRRPAPMRTALLRLLDDSTPRLRNVLIIGETQMPWAVDRGVMARFNAAVAGPVPDAATRDRLMRQCLSGFDKERDLFARMNDWTEGWDARHIRGLCNSAAAHAVTRSGHNPDSKTKITAADVQSVLPHFRFGTSAGGDAPGMADAYVAFGADRSPQTIGAPDAEGADLRDFYEVCQNLVEAHQRLRNIGFALGWEKDTDSLALNLEDRDVLESGLAIAFIEGGAAVHEAVVEAQETGSLDGKLRAGSEFLASTRRLVLPLKRVDEANALGFARDRDYASRGILPVLAGR